MNALLTILQRILGKNLEVDLASYLAKGAMKSLMVQVSGLVLTFLLSFALVKWLGPAGYGRFTYIFAWLAVLATIAVFGMDTLLVKEIALKDDSQQHGTVIRFAFLTTLIASILVGGVALVIVNYLYTPSDEMRWLFMLALGSLPFYTMMIMFQGALRGRRKVVSGQFPDKIVRPLFLLGGCAGLVLAINQLDVEQAILGNVFSFTAAFFLTGFLVRKHFSLKPQTERKPWLRTCLFFTITSIVALLNVRADILMLGWLTNDTVVGVYNISARFADFVSFPLLIIIPVINPAISKLFAGKQRKELQTLVTRTTRVNTVLGVIVVGLLLVTGEWLLSLFGNEFGAGYDVLLLLGMAHILNVAFGPVGNILNMCGKAKLAFYGQLAGTITNLVLNYILIPEFEIMGAAIATACGFVVWNTVSAIFVWREVGIDSTLMGIPKWR